MSFHNYFGPGNKKITKEDIKKNPPIDKDDEIALAHDLAYQNAKNKQQIFEADHKAIEQFAKDSENWHSNIGLAAIGAKNILEEKILKQTLYPFAMPDGKISMTPEDERLFLYYTSHYGYYKVYGYPKEFYDLLNKYNLQYRQVFNEPSQIQSNESIKRPLNNNPQQQHQQSKKPKQPILDISSNPSAEKVGPLYQIEETSKQVQQQQMPNHGGYSESTMGEVGSSGSGQAGGSKPGGTGSSIGLSNVIADSPNTDTSQIFTKQFQIITGGFQYEHLSRESNNVARSTLIPCGNEGILLTSLACIDPDNIALYLTPKEFDNLPLGSYATHCKIEITPLGYRLPFATNEAASVFANSQTLIQIQHGIGLNLHYNCAIGSYEYTDSDYTNISSFGKTIMNYRKVLYEGENDLEPGACVGLPVHWNLYTGILQKNPILTQLLKIENVNDIKGNPIINYEYDFKEGLLKPSQSTLEEGSVDALPTAQLMGYRQPQDFGEFMGVDFTYGRFYNTAKTDWDHSYQIYPPNDSFSYETRIEKCHWMTSIRGNYANAKAPPLIHFGVLPVQSNPALSTAKHYSPVVLMWKIKTSIIIKQRWKFTGGDNFYLSQRSLNPLYSHAIAKIPQLASTNLTNVPDQQKVYLYISGRLAQCYPVNPKKQITTSIWQIKKKQQQSQSDQKKDENEYFMIE